MKKISKISRFGIIIICIALVSCTNNLSTGQTIKEARTTGSFDGVALAFSGDVYITQGNTLKVEVEADKDVMDIIVSEISGSTLVLKTRDHTFRNIGTVKVYVTMPEISKLSVSGSGDMICKSIKTDEIDLNVSGSGSMEVNLEAREVSVIITGSGDIEINAAGNTANEMDVTITGSGSFEATRFPVKEVDAKITGSGSANVNAMDELETNITGSGSVNYKGNPLINATASGSGKTRSIN